MKKHYSITLYQRDYFRAIADFDADNAKSALNFIKFIRENIDLLEEDHDKYILVSFNSRRVNNYTQKRFHL